MTTTKKVKGFTLIELMIVIACISALLAILMPFYTSYVERANNAADLTNIHHMINAVNEAFMFGEDGGFYDNCWGWENNPSNKDTGYIYVDSDEVRTSSLAVARLLEKMGYITDSDHPDKTRGDVKEPCYTIRRNSRIRCMSSKKWCRYQLNFRRNYENNTLEWGITCATRRFSTNNFHEDEMDEQATKEMAERVGVEPFLKDLGGLD